MTVRVLMKKQASACTLALAFGLSLYLAAHADQGVGPSVTSCPVILRSETSQADCDLLVMAPAEFADLLEGFVFHKSLMGLKTTLVSLESVTANTEGRDDPERIKRFIADHALTHGTRFALGVGDVDRFPVRYAEVWRSSGYDMIYDEHWVPADLYYADLFDQSGEFCDWDANGNDTFGESTWWVPNADEVDFIPDVVFSRLPVGSLSELFTVVSKTINYELNVKPTSTGFNEVLLCGASISSSGAEGEYDCEKLAQTVFSDYNPTRLYETTTFERDARLTAENAISYLNEGCGFATYCGHGLSRTWAFGLYADDVMGLTNENMLPFVSAASCKTCGFDNENWQHPDFPDSDCIGEAFVLCPQGGAIGYAGASRIAYDGGDEWTCGLYQMDRINHLCFKAHKDGYRRMGEMLRKAIEDYMIDSLVPCITNVWTIMEYSLLGDPTVKVGGEAFASPVHVQLDAPRRVALGETVSLTVSCTNFEGEREVSLAVVLVSNQGEELFYPNWGPEVALLPLMVPAGFAIEGVELCSLDTSACCQVGYNTVYALMLDPNTLEWVSNLGGCCMVVSEPVE